jgi:hypothetical protein
MLSDLPGGCHSTPRWGPHGSSQPCCLPPQRLPWAVAAGYPELVWSFCALAGQSFVCHPFQHPRSCLLQRGSCNRTRRPRSLRRGRPNDRHAVPRPPHRLPDPSSLLHTLRHGNELTGTLGCARCPVTRREARSPYPTGTAPTGRLPRRSGQLRAGASANRRKCPLDLSTAKSAAEGRQS